jgi:hypothetical protein
MPYDPWNDWWGRNVLVGHLVSKRSELSRLIQDAYDAITKQYTERMHIDELLQHYVKIKYTPEFIQRFERVEGLSDSRSIGWKIERIKSNASARVDSRSGPFVDLMEAKELVDKAGETPVTYQENEDNDGYHPYIPIYGERTDDDETLAALIGLIITMTSHLSMVNMGPDGRFMLTDAGIKFQQVIDALSGIITSLEMPKN